MDSIRVSTELKADPAVVYQAWLDSKKHSAFTGGKAVIDPGAGGGFSAWDGYIQGTTIQVEAPKRIVQKWRTTDFPADSPDSDLEVLLEETRGGTRITLVHTGIPDGQGEEYEKGWQEHYFRPMSEYFAAG